MKACLQIAECSFLEISSLFFAKIVKNIMPCKFYALFFRPAPHFFTQ